MTVEFGEHFRQPESIADASARLMQLSQELHTINQQLADRHRKEKLGINDNDYSNWKLKATHARNSKMMQCEKLRHWIEEQRAMHAVNALQTQNPVSIISELVDLVNNIRQRVHVTITSDEQNLLSLANKIVNEEPAR